MSSGILRACVVLATVGACAKTPSPETAPLQPGAIVTSDAQPQASSERRNRDVITKEEMQSAAMGSQSVLEVVKALRPSFLTVRGVHAAGDSQTGTVHASIDGNRLVVLDELRTIMASTVVEIRFLNPAAAMQKFGGSAREGPVILVKTM